MSNDCENLYKVCRTSAGLTQEQAAELLGVAPRTLSDYENERTRVPDDIVDAMSRIYKAPLLAWWHGDMTAQLCIAEWRLRQVVDEIQRIMENGRVEEHEKMEFQKAIGFVRQINSKLLSVIVYAEGVTQ